ncbi:MAG TPA: alpha-amylase family glycosyl hydrolase [Solirubrobacteraceae bacterium]|nr:alpha-amylase family glycosyl hydrolase [Solirubrobacteraceae bacterium]
MSEQRASAMAALGAVPHDDGTTTFRAWAPNAGSLAVRTGGGDEFPLARGDGDVFEGRGPAAPGTDYRFVLDGGRALPDPWSRAQPEGLDGPSRVVDLGALGISSSWTGLCLRDLVIYELHVGTFTEEGTFDSAIPRLQDLRELGVTAIEIMPIATFAGNHGWGYDGVYTYAPHPACGGPEGFARLVDAAHAVGLAVILDVVYNHMGAGSDAVEAFGPYTTAGSTTIWGGAIDYAEPAVREWAIQNAEMWVRDYRVDGLRLDAVHAIVDDRRAGGVNVMAELAQRVRAIHPGALIISEMEIGDLRPIEEWGHDAQWGDALHHAVHVLLTGEREGYYADYGRVEDVARELRRPQRERFVVCAQNHDQVGNRALGDRLHGADLRLAAFCSILSPGTPLLFEGEEYDEPHPFQYFTDHTDPKIAQMTRDGRREEFAAFSDFSGEEIPDPQDPETFLRSKLDPSAGDPDHRRYYEELLALRRQLGDAPLDVEEVDEERRVLHARRGELELVANFSDQEHDGVPPRSGVVRR